MTTIRYGFSTSQAWYSQVIRYFTKAQCSHTFMVVTDFYGRDMILEEGVKGWSLRTLEDLAKRDKIVEIIDPKYPVAPGFKISLDDLGSRYWYEGLFGMFPVMIARHFGKRIRNPFRSSHSMICSERGMKILQDSKYPGSEGYDPATTTPEDLRLFLKGDSK